MFCEKTKKTVIGNLRKQIECWLLEECSTEQNPRSLISRGSICFSVNPKTVKSIIFVLLGSRELLSIKNGYCLIRRDVLGGAKV